MTERCEVTRCRAETAITYLDHGVCESHWDQLTAEDAPPDALRIALGIEATAPAATEDSTMESTTSKTTKPAKGPKSTVKAKAAKPKKEKAAREPQVVFAFRLSEADRDLIHQAAGRGRATRFVLGAALSAANGDTKAFDALAGQARSNLK